MTTPTSGLVEYTTTHNLSRREYGSSSGRVRLPRVIRLASSGDTFISGHGRFMADVTFTHFEVPMVLKAILPVQSALIGALLLAISAPGTGADVVLRPEPRPVLESQPLRFRATVTAYSSSPDETWGDPFVTASGRHVFDGLVACPREFAFGTKFKIGSRTYQCFDRLHDKYDDRFDIWMSTKNQALQFGKRQLLVEVL
jgi:3D (Asp-Asp-Asp) domain-containing protein